MESRKAIAQGLGREDCDRLFFLGMYPVLERAEVRSRHNLTGGREEVPGFFLSHCSLRGPKCNPRVSMSCDLLKRKWTNATYHDPFGSLMPKLFSPHSRFLSLCPPARPQLNSPSLANKIVSCNWLSDKRIRTETKSFWSTGTATVTQIASHMLDRQDFYCSTKKQLKRLSFTILI